MTSAAERLGVTVNAVDLAWLLQRSPILSPIPETPLLDQLCENLAALELDLGEANGITC